VAGTPVSGFTSIDESTNFNGSSAVNVFASANGLIDFNEFTNTEGLNFDESTNFDGLIDFNEFTNAEWLIDLNESTNAEGLNYVDELASANSCFNFDEFTNVD
jgi:hypothetical protein